MADRLRRRADEENVSSRLPRKARVGSNESFRFRAEGR